MVQNMMENIESHLLWKR